MEKVKAGPMRKVIRIEQQTSTRDSSGEPLPNWDLIGQRRAEKLDFKHGSEVWSGRERSGRVPTQFRIRFPHDFVVLPKMRLTCDGDLYDIISAVDLDGRKKELHIMCEKQVEEPIE